MTTISAQTVLRSRNTASPDKVLSTLLLRYPRWIHAEQRTHRVIPLDEGLSFLKPTQSLMADPNLSRNAASGRAIPVRKMIEDVRTDPATPLFWGKNIGGMQAKEELTGDYLLEAQAIWQEAMEAALSFAEQMTYLGVDEGGRDVGTHKQIVNRLLEPFNHITVLVSATEWSNFLELRDHGDAEPHIAMLAREVRKCLDNDPVIDLEPGEWHLPFVISYDQGREDFGGYREEIMGAIPEGTLEDAQDALFRKLSTSMCASTSYKTVDGFDMTLERAIALHDKLVAARPIHASPAEHVAQADDYGEEYRDGLGAGWANPDQHGNYIGFRQYRHML